MKISDTTLTITLQPKHHLPVQKFQTAWNAYWTPSRTHTVNLDLHLPLEINGNLLHVLHLVSGEDAVGQKHSANTLQLSARRGHVPGIPIAHRLQANAIIIQEIKQRTIW